LAVFILPIVPHFSYSYIYYVKNHSINLFFNLLKKLLLKNYSKTIPKFEKPAQKPIQKIAMKNSRSTIHKIFILIKAKSNLTGKYSPYFVK